MEKMTVSEAFRSRALEALKSAEDAIGQEHKETAVSRAYYACFFAVHSRLETLKLSAASHKQTGILFRKHFIATGLMDKKFSGSWEELQTFRMDADYAPVPDITPEKARDLVSQAEEFVNQLLRTKI